VARVGAEEARRRGLRSPSARGACRASAAEFEAAPNLIPVRSAVVRRRPTRRTGGPALAGLLDLPRVAVVTSDRARRRPPGRAARAIRPAAAAWRLLRVRTARRAHPWQTSINGTPRQRPTPARRSKQARSQGPVIVARAGARLALLTAADVRGWAAGAFSQRCALPSRTEHRPRGATPVAGRARSDRPRRSPRSFREAVPPGVSGVGSADRRASPRARGETARKCGPVTYELIRPAGRALASTQAFL